jgi:hypothetical protein
MRDEGWRNLVVSVLRVIRGILRLLQRLRGSAQDDCAPTVDASIIQRFKLLTL